MKIISYDKYKQHLRVRYNTKTVWEYSGIDVVDFNLLNSSQSSKVLGKILRRLNIVGINKGVV